MKNDRSQVDLPEMAAFWAVWLIMFGLAFAMSSCKSANFAGKGGGSNAPGTTNARPEGSTPLQSGNNGGKPEDGTNGTNGNNGNNGSNGGINTGDGTSTVVSVPMRILYNSTESGSGGYDGGFEFAFKYQNGQEVMAARFNAGGKGEITVPSACACGQKNNIDLFITADGQKRNLQGWHNEVMTSHNHPETGSDWQSWLKSGSVKPLPDGNHALYLGGFDHIFLFGTSCGKFACDDRKWNNRDDTKIIFICQIDGCPDKEKGFELGFVGMDP